MLSTFGNLHKDSNGLVSHNRTAHDRTKHYITA
nr:MAG TPA: hypothetical protein [Caudoviricetes sp.]